MSETNQTNGDGPMSEEERQQLKLQRLKTCQTLITVALVGAPVSLLMGGVALSVSALVCAIIAFVKMRKTMEPSDGQGSLARMLYIQSIVALVASCVATCLNAVAFVFMFGAEPVRHVRRLARIKLVVQRFGLGLGFFRVQTPSCFPRVTSINVKLR